MSQTNGEGNGHRWEQQRITRRAAPGGRPAPAAPADGDLLPLDGASHEPDVLLDVPTLKVDEITLEVEQLDARVSLQAEVLDLLRLNVGADVVLGRVDLTLKGVEAQALLKVRLANVAHIIERVLRTIDRNPELLRDVTRGAGATLRDVGAGTRHAVGEVSAGAGHAVRDVGLGAGGAVRDVASGAGHAVRDVGSGAGGAVRDVGNGAGYALSDLDNGASGATQTNGAGEFGSGRGGSLGSGASRAPDDGDDAKAGQQQEAEDSGADHEEPQGAQESEEAGEPRETGERQEAEQPHERKSAQLAAELGRWSLHAGREGLEHVTGAVGAMVRRRSRRRMTRWPSRGSQPRPMSKYAPR